MAKKNFYAVKAGREKGIFKTWSECLASVTGYGGATYKGFSTEDEAKEFLYDYKKTENVEIPKVKENFNKNIDIKAENIKYGYDVTPLRSKANVICSKVYVDPENVRCDYEFIAFVDGSYDKVTKTYGSGVVVLDFKKNSYNTYFRAGYDEWDQWNIVGELEAVKLALTKAQELSVKNVAIYHDLKNISLWANGEWQAKNKYTQEYVRFIEDMSKSLNIYFVKVKAHSDESIYNDIADESAKKAILDYKGKGI
ncbi:MAG: ribonuclease H family protein [Clostridium sp.]